MALSTVVKKVESMVGLKAGKKVEKSDMKWAQWKAATLVVMKVGEMAEMMVGMKVDTLVAKTDAHLVGKLEGT